MTRQDDIKKLLSNKHRRLRLLQERKALYGLDTPLVILTELEDIQAEIEALEAELAYLEPAPPSSAPLDQPGTTGPDHESPGLVRPLPDRSHIFISYKRDVAPDEAVALQLFQELSHEHDIFIDRMMPPGTPWAERIRAELLRSDFFIIFLSAESVHSEMVLAEITMAHDLANLQGGRPKILPVRLAHREPFQYPLSEYLNPINWSFWRHHRDTSRIIQELKLAIAGQDLPVNERLKPYLLQDSPGSALPEPPAAAQPARLEMPEGTMDPHSTFYIKRPSDAVALRTIEQSGVTITIKAPRQMGKSSLLMQIIEAAAQAGKRVAFLDFQLFDKSTLMDADTFFRQFCIWLTDELEMENRVEAYWDTPLGNSQRCTRYLSRYILKEADNPLLLAMDEVDSIFGADFRSDFFSMLRGWHNNRASRPIWKQLDLALVTSTEPYLLIENLNQSPFNVGEIIELKDFTLEQGAELNHRHGLPLSPDQIKRLMALLGGHPFLVRRALYLVASRRLSADELFSQATADRGPFGDHLRYHLFRLHGREDLMQGLHQVINHHTCSDKQIFFRLRGAGLVRQEDGAIVPRCQLYADYFRGQLNG